MLKPRSILEKIPEIALRVCRFFLQFEVLPFACFILVQITALSLWRAPKFALHHLARLLRR